MSGAPSGGRPAPSPAGREIPAPGRWAIVPERSRVGFVGRYLTVGRIRGRFSRFRGVLLVAEVPEESSLEVAIEAASVETGVGVLDRLLRARMHGGRFPNLRFRSRAVEVTGDRSFLLHGELTVRDITRPVAIDVQYAGLTSLPDERPEAAFRGRAEVDRAEFGFEASRLRWLAAWMVRREIRIELDVRAVLAGPG